MNNSRLGHKHCVFGNTKEFSRTEEPRISRSVDGKIGWFSKGRTTRFFVGIVLVFGNLSDIFDAEDFLFQLGKIRLSDIALQIMDRAHLRGKLVAFS